MRLKTADPWSISPDEFPARGTTVDQWKFLLRYAVLAPSSHNTQPWLFHIRYTLLDIFADRRRSCPVVDPNDRELIMSCGCALFHLTCAMRHYKCLGRVQILPNSHPDLVARVHFGNEGETNPEHGLLFDAITKRRTNRQSFKEEKIPESLLAAIANSASEEGAWMSVVEEEKARHSLAELISEGDRIQWKNPEFRRELSQWVHANNSSRMDGIPGYAVGVDDLLSYTVPLVVRTFDMGQGQGAKDYELAAGSPALAVIGTDGNTPRDWVIAGQALARVLLRGRAEEIWASFLNQPIEVPELRPRLAELADRKGVPQLVLRFGYADNVQPTPRRPVSEVLTSRT